MSPAESDGDDMMRLDSHTGRATVLTGIAIPAIHPPADLIPIRWIPRALAAKPAIDSPEPPPEERHQQALR